MMRFNKGIERAYSVRRTRCRIHTTTVYTTGDDHDDFKTHFDTSDRLIQTVHFIVQKN